MIFILDITLSDSGIKGTKIHLPQGQTSSQEDAQNDPLQVFVDKCNEENDFGDSNHPDFVPKDQWRSEGANVKRED